MHKQLNKEKQMFLKCMITNIFSSPEILIALKPETSQRADGKEKELKGIRTAIFGANFKNNKSNLYMICIAYFYLNFHQKAYYYSS